MKITFYTLILFALLIQGCTFWDTMQARTASELGYEHPEDKLVTEKSGSSQLGDLVYIKSVFRNVFLTAESTQDEKDFVDQVFAYELHGSYPMLGRPCDVLLTGDSLQCHYSHINAKLNMSGSTSSGREASKVQACRQFLRHDAIMNRFVTRVSQNVPTLTLSSATTIVRMFYPAKDDGDAKPLAQALLTLDRKMADLGEPVLDRWRLVTLTVCESEQWEIL